MGRQFAPVRAAAIAVAVTLLCGRVTSAASPTAAEVMRRAEEQFQKFTDYECVIDTDSHLGSRSEAGTYHFWFKKPHLIRGHVDRGRDHGSDVVVEANGQIHGRKGGLLKPFAITLRPDDRRIRSIRGVSLTELDWGSFYRSYREGAARPGARIVLLPHQAESAPYEVSLQFTEAGKQVREIYRIDAARWVMVEGDRFEDGAQVDHAAFHDIRLNSGVPASFFHF